MRELADAERIRRFMKAFGGAASRPELASPADFMPLPDGWRDRSPFVAQEGMLVFRNFDLLSQAPAKLERAHARDLGDVQAMLDGGLVERDELLRAYDAIEGELWRFPAIDPGAFRSRVAEYSALDG